jgi:hypothetical protein
MSITLIVWPGAEDRTVKLPNGSDLTTANCPPGGVKVAWSVYIQRRLACGDLTQTQPKIFADAQAAADAQANAAAASKAAAAAAATAAADRAPTKAVPPAPPTPAAQN